MVSEFSFLFVKHRGLKHSRSCSHKEELRVHYRSIILGADYPITPFIFFFFFILGGKFFHDTFAAV